MNAYWTEGCGADVAEMDAALTEADIAKFMPKDNPVPTTGECQTKRSPLCSGTGMLREYPLDMLTLDNAFRKERMIYQCLPCYEDAADEFVDRSHRPEAYQ